MHIVTLSFDDGFLNSCLKIAAAYEECGLSACFNVIATGHQDSFEVPDSGQADCPKGDFALWNVLQARGHEIMPHGYRHANKANLSFQDAQRLILECLAVFEHELAGFRSEEAIFNFPYNASTPAIEAWLPTVTRAFRTGGDGINSLPDCEQIKLTTTGFGPGNCEQHLDRELERLLDRPSGWLIYNTHGVDDEGWGPIRLEYLKRLLGRLQQVSTVRILPTGKALRLAPGKAPCLSGIDMQGNGELRQER